MIIAHYIVQLQMIMAQNKWVWIQAKICRRCLALEKELAECRVLAKAVECELEA